MNWVRQHNTLASIGSGFDFMFGMSVTIGTAIALFIGVTHVKAGRLSLGDLLLLIAYMAQLQLMLRQGRIVVQVPDWAAE